MANTPNITPELREELRALLKLELERSARNRTVFRRITEDFEDELRKYDYVEAWSCINCDGNPVTQAIPHSMGYKVRDALGTLLRAIYSVNTVTKLPADKEREMREFIGDVLALMAERKETK